MIQLIKTNQRLHDEPLIIEKWNSIIIDAYNGKDIQHELKSALPLFLENIAQNLSINDILSNDLSTHRVANDLIIDIIDTFTPETILGIVLQSFIGLNVSNKTFHVVEGHMIGVLDTKKRIENINDELIIEKTFNNILSEGKKTNLLDLKIEEFCQEITEKLQYFIDGYSTIILYKLNLIKSYDEDFNPKIIFRFILKGLDNIPRQPPASFDIHIGEFKPITPLTERYSKATHIEDNYSDIHIESEDKEFEKEFEKRNKIKPNFDNNIHDENLNIDKMGEKIALKSPIKTYKVEVNQHVGAYEWGMPGFKRGMVPYDEKPSIWHRVLMRLLLGISWIDYKKH